MSAERLHDLIERIANLLRSELRTVATREGLKLAQLEALLYLCRANRYSDTTLAVVDYVGATKGTVSQTLSALFDKGLIERKSDGDDGRVRHLRPTRAGRAIAKSAYPSALLRGAESDELEAKLDTLLTTMQRARAGRSFGQCRTCSHFRKLPRGHQCGLTGEPLTVPESRLLCREHARAGP